MLYSDGIVRKSIDSIAWQDYRASETGMIIMYTSDPVSEIPIREVPEELLSTDILPEPNYETGTYGFFGCARIKARSAFVKSKIRYLFFMTKYEGTREEFREKLYVTGYYRIVKTVDVNRIHLRYLSDSACMNTDICVALRADEVQFVALDDAFEVTPEVLENWEHKSKITKQSRILIDEDKTSELMQYLRSKENAVETYINETKRLEPHDPADDEDEDEDNDGDVTPMVFEDEEEQESNDKPEAEAVPVVETEQYIPDTPAEPVAETSTETVFEAPVEEVSVEEPAEAPEVASYESVQPAAVVEETPVEAAPIENIQIETQTEISASSDESESDTFNPEADKDKPENQ